MSKVVIGEPYVVDDDVVDDEQWEFIGYPEDGDVVPFVGRTDTSTARTMHRDDTYEIADECNLVTKKPDGHYELAESATPVNETNSYRIASQRGKAR